MSSDLSGQQGAGGALAEGQQQAMQKLPIPGSSVGTYLCREHEGSGWVPTAGFHRHMCGKIVSTKCLAPCPTLCIGEQWESGGKLAL